MSDYLSRSQSPLTGEQWEIIDQTVVNAARQILVGRRFLPIYGPFGAGLQTVAADVLSGVEVGVSDLLGEAEDEPIAAKSRRTIDIPIIHKDFVVLWRDLETVRQFSLPFDPSLAAAAAIFCAHAEDKLIFYGDAGLGHEGILSAQGRSTLKLGDWSEPGKAFDNVLAATETLLQTGFYGPYILAVSPRLYSSMNRIYANTGVLEIEQVQKLVSAVYRSPDLAEPTAAVISTGPQNLDLVVAQDLVTAYLEASKMNHYFRVFESVALRIKRPGAICTLEAK